MILFFADSMYDSTFTAIESDKAPFAQDEERKKKIPIRVVGKRDRRLYH